MNRVVCVLVLFCGLDALKRAECFIATTAEELTYIMQNTMKERGPRCTSGVVDMMFLQGASWAVRCSAYGERSIDVEASLILTCSGGPFTNMTVSLSPSGTMKFQRQDGVVDDQYGEPGQTFYLIEKYDDDDDSWRAKYDAQPPRYRRWNKWQQKWEVD